MNTKLVYLDHASSTPIDALVADVLQEAQQKFFGNPSNTLHPYGVESYRALESARSTVAELLNVMPSEIIFTSGATEANNMFISGYVDHSAQILISKIEHASIFETASARSLKSDSATIAVDSAGYVMFESFMARVADKNRLVSLILANNEVGTIQPIEKFVSVCEQYKIPIHSDCVQAVGKIPIDLKSIGLSAATISSHKIYGPKGVGVLYLKKQWQPMWKSLFHGGQQEHGLRGGTENVPAIIAFAKALELSVSRQKDESVRLKKLVDIFWQKLASANLPVFKITPQDGLPGLLSFGFKQLRAIDILARVPELCLSTGSACSVGEQKISRVLEAMGIPPDQAQSVMRFSAGRKTSEDDASTAARRFVDEAKFLYNLAGKT